jgi:VWFA-related protein
MALVALGVASPAATDQAPAERSETPPQFAVAAERVVVDFVVRDKKREPLRGLTATDVEVYEDGERQAIESFQWVERSRGPESTPAADCRALAAAGSPSDRPLVALVFDRLSPNARLFASRAAATWLDNQPRPQWTGVFLADQGIRTLQPFTEDAALARQAVNKIPSIAPAPQDVNRDRERLRNLRSAIRGGAPDAGIVAAEFPGPQFPGMGPLRPGEGERIRMEIRMLEATLAIDMEQQGRATVGGLLGIVNGLASVPGRKTVVLFSEGLSLPASIDPLFLSLIAAANRANVSVYAMDAGGLRTRSGNEEMRREMLDLRPREWTPENGGGGSLGGLEKNEQMLRLSPEVALVVSRTRPEASSPGTRTSWARPSDGSTTT